MAYCSKYTREEKVIVYEIQRLQSVNIQRRKAILETEKKITRLIAKLKGKYKPKESNI